MLQQETTLRKQISFIAAHSEINVTTYQDSLQLIWDEYVISHPSGSLFHLTAWKRVIERTFGFEPRYLCALERGRIRGVLPLFLVPNILQGRSLISTPFAVYGGACADNEQISRELRASACEMARQEQVQYLELREQTSLSDPAFHTKQLYVSFDKELPPSAEELLGGFPRDTRYMIRKATKSGLHAESGLQALDIFYEIYARSFHHLGTPVFSRRFFHVIVEEFGELCELTTVWNGAKSIAGVLSFRFGKWILPYFGGSLKEGRQVGANNFMYWEVMKSALENGLRYFDFGRSKLGSGSYSFKTQWNMRERPLPYQFFLVRRKNMPNYSPVNPKFQMAISLWRAMPFALTKMAGPALVKLFP